MPDLLKEWLALPGLNCRCLEQLARYGVSRRAEMLAGGVGYSKAHTIGRCWIPDPVGRGLFVLGIWLDEPPSPFGGDDDPVLLDLLAFHPARPDTWFYRHGDGGLLGGHHYDAAVETGQPIVLFSHPLAWLQADCSGAVLLDYEHDSHHQIWERAA